MQPRAETSLEPISFPLSAADRPAASGPHYAWLTLPANDPRVADAACWAITDGATSERVQVRPLGAKRDGSPRWWMCEAILPHGGPFTLQAVDEAPACRQAACVRDDGRQLVLDNSLLRVTFDRHDESIIHEICYQGRPICDAGAVQLQYQSRGMACVSRVRVERHEIISAGPVRAGVEVFGRCLTPDGQPGLDVRVRVELCAQLPVVLLRYWFLHRMTGVEELAVDRMSLTVAMRGATGEHHFIQSQHGLTAVPRAVRTRQPIDARVGHDGAMALRLANPSALADNNEYPSYLMPPLDRIEPWLAMQTQNAWCAASVDDLVQMQPKGLKLADGRFTLDVWPDWAPPLRLPQGRSRSTTMRLAFFAADSSPPDRASIEATLQATRPVAPMLLDPSVYAEAEVFEQEGLLPRHAKQARRFDDYLRRVACPPTVSDFMDLGDTPDPGYSRTYLATGRRLERIVTREQARPIQFLTNGYAAEWCDLTQFEKVWANNEYDVIWCIGSEMLRSRRPELFQSLQWFSRHAIEVDFVHYSDQPVKHRSTPPHCARHTTAGTYPSHLWTQGLLQYYALSGDEDALAFAQAIGDKIIDIFNMPSQRDKLWNPTRELGWALLATAALAEMDPREKYLNVSRDMADALIAVEPTDAYVHDVVRYSFGYASIALGLDRWHAVCGERRYADWIGALARQCAQRMLDDSGVVGTMGLCILHLGYRHTGDTSLLRCGMRTVERLMDSRMWFDPPMYTKPLAMLYRPLSRFFAGAAEAGLLESLDYRF